MESMSGETYSPHQSRSSPVFTTIVISSAGMIWRRPSTNFAPPVPPERTQIIVVTPSCGPLDLRQAFGVDRCAEFFRQQARLRQNLRHKFGIHRQALAQLKPLGFGVQAQLLQMRPGLF